MNIEAGSHRARVLAVALFTVPACAAADDGTSSTVDPLEAVAASPLADVEARGPAAVRSSGTNERSSTACSADRCVTAWVHHRASALPMIDLRVHAPDGTPLEERTHSLAIDGYPYLVDVAYGAGGFLLTWNQETLCHDEGAPECTSALRDRAILGWNLDLDGQPIEAAPFPLTAPGVDAGAFDKPVAAFDGERFLVVWSQAARIEWAAPRELWGTFLEKGTPPPPPFRIAGGRSAERPSIALQGGRRLVVWSEADNVLWRGDPTSDARVRGAFVEGPADVRPAGGFALASTPSIEVVAAPLGDGYVVAYRSDGGSSLEFSELVVQVLAPDGSLSGPARDVAWTDFPPRLAAGPWGTWLALPYRFMPDPSEKKPVFNAIELATDGAMTAIVAAPEWPLDFESYEGHETASYTFTSTRDGLLFTWSSPPPYTGGSGDEPVSDVQQGNVAYPGASLPAVGPRLLSSGRDAQVGPDVAAGEAGFLVAFADYAAGWDHPEIRGRLYDPSGAPRGPAFVVAPQAPRLDPSSIRVHRVGTSYAVTWRVEDARPNRVARVSDGGAVGWTLAPKESECAFGSSGTQLLGLCKDAGASTARAWRLDGAFETVASEAVPFPAAATFACAPDAVAWDGNAFVVAWSETAKGEPAIMATRLEGSPPATARIANAACGSARLAAGAGGEVALVGTRAGRGFLVSLDANLRPRLPETALGTIAEHGRPAYAGGAWVVGAITGDRTANVLALGAASRVGLFAGASGVPETAGAPRIAIHPTGTLVAVLEQRRATPHGDATRVTIESATLRR